ncbi:hypothetical protein PG291_01835 [Riemerella anatipestifer]|nr:hypothetical protein [Riemerella anatipestifer]
MKRIVCLLLFCLMSISITAQIVIREKDIVEKAVMKPKPFDSLSNLVMQERLIDYKKYIGYKLFCLPKSDKFKHERRSEKDYLIDYLYSKDTTLIVKDGKIPFDKVYIYSSYRNFDGTKKEREEKLKIYEEKKRKYDETIDKTTTNRYLPKFYHSSTEPDDGEIHGSIATPLDSLAGRYFTILDIQAKEDYSQRKVTEGYVKLEDLEEYRDWSVSLKITLRDEERQKEFYWIVRQGRNLDGKFATFPFFLVPYFEKKRETYLNKRLILNPRHENYYNNKLKDLVDINTGEVIDMNKEKGNFWTCTDVSFVDTKNHFYKQCFYFLKNGDREVKISLESGLLEENFILESEYNELKKKEELKRKESEEREKKRLEEIEQFKRDCIAKWGQKIGNYIANGKVILGMNKEMCEAAWGSPININRTIIKGLISEQWVYGFGTYLYFDNGKLIAIQD